MLWKQPGFSVIAALTLALGIGATSAIFSLIQRVLLTPPPYRNPEQPVLTPSARTDGKKVDSRRGWAAEQWIDWNKESTSFSELLRMAGPSGSGHSGQGAYAGKKRLVKVQGAVRRWDSAHPEAQYAS
jgi:hypothetical protein